MLPGVEVEQLLPLLLLHLFLQRPPVGCLAVGAGLGPLWSFGDLRPALFVLLLLLRLLLLLLRFLSREHDANLSGGCRPFYRGVWHDEEGRTSSFRLS